ncbi:helix-turn-helix domain-containing protein, partial [Methanoregula sp.]|uniref:helix-turn-helix domain-containing protein n=1 Tax=Methanoregula sp. TaxID=2052170 RepID=UPI000CB3FC36
MSRVLERRRQLLHLMREFTLEKGFFTTTDIQQSADVPRSTVQDWINRLLDEGCVLVREEQHGRAPARYVSTSTVPSTACRRIFTTTDGEFVEIYHDCMSSACAAFCGFHHGLAGGALCRVSRDGTLLRECARFGSAQADVGLFPAPSVAVIGIEREGDSVVQTIRCVGGPAYSLTDMMALAKGVTDVKISRSGPLVEGKVYTKALVHLAIGIDDTDSRAGGATFALALALLQHLGSMKGIFPIAHRIVMLNPAIAEKTAGNSCSFIEIATEPAIVEGLPEKIFKFVADEALSPEWGIAIKRGFTIPPDLRSYGIAARKRTISRGEAEILAKKYGITLHGGRGVI